MGFWKKRGANTNAGAGAGAGRLPAGSRRIPLLLTVLLVALAGASCTAPASTAGSDDAPSQAAPSDTMSLDALADTLAPAEAARYAFRGRDLKGKDGPMARVGYDLAHLYFAYRAHEQAAPGEAFEPPRAARVTDGRVVIDATAAESAERLRADLDALGLVGGAVAGPLVSGRLPIAALPQAARLTSLRSMRVSLGHVPPQPSVPAPVGSGRDSSRAPFH